MSGLPGIRKFLHLSPLRIWIVISSQWNASCGWLPPCHHWCTLSPPPTWCASPASESRKPMHRLKIRSQYWGFVYHRATQHWSSKGLRNRKGLRLAYRQILLKFFIRYSLEQVSQFKVKHSLLSLLWWADASQEWLFEVPSLCQSFVIWLQL